MTDHLQPHAMTLNRAFLCVLAVLAFTMSVRGEDQSLLENKKEAQFAQQVDLKPLLTLAVHENGRLKSFDSFARSTMHLVSGSHQIFDQHPAFTYLDLILNEERYATADIIYVKAKPIRGQIIDTLTRVQAGSDLPDFDARMKRFQKTGLISISLLNHPKIMDLLARLAVNLKKTARPVGMIREAMFLKDKHILLDRLRIIPPATDDKKVGWLSLNDVLGFTESTRPILLDQATIDQVDMRWRTFITAWLKRDATAVNTAAIALADLIKNSNPKLYPDQKRLEWESWYFQSYNMTWIWVIYLLSLIPMLAAIIYRWPAARWIGLFVFLAAFALHTFAIGLRWYVAQRWPNTNMFEAVTTAAWFGGVGAVVLELLTSRSPMRGLFAICSAIASMVAMMCVWFMPLSLDAGISNRMPVLHNVWLYIHTNVIIFSYCLIFMAAGTATMYLIYRMFAAMSGFQGRKEYARVGGAGSLILPGPNSDSTMSRAAVSFGRTLDGATMVLMELSFILLWTGLVMGAIWADHSWGRPWGWDPKEVFALNTFIVFAVLVHTRINAKDKALWTALIALLGAGVMLFNWIVINFVIQGLHSYA